MNSSKMQNSWYIENRCCVRGCLNTGLKAKMHRFSKNVGRCEVWLHALGNAYDDKGHPIPITRMWRKHICSLHFESSCYTEQNCLKRNAIPTIHLGDTFANNVKPVNDIEISPPPSPHRGDSPTPLARISNMDFTHATHLTSFDRPALADPVRTYSHQTDHTYSLQFDGNQMKNEAVEQQSSARMPQDISTVVSKSHVDAVANTIKISPLPSPHREDSPTPLAHVPNIGGNFKGQFGVELKVCAEAGGRDTLAPILKISDTDGLVSGVTENTAPPGPRVVNPVPYRMNKLNTGPANHSTKNMQNKILPKRNGLPTCCRTIYDKWNANVTELRKQLCSVMRRARVQSFESVTNKMPLIMRTFVRMQADMIKKKTRAHRFKEEQKLLCLALYAANPTAYKFMSAIFKMPCRMTLKNCLNPAKTDMPQHADATKKPQEDFTPAYTPDAVLKSGADMPTFDDTEVSAAIAAIAPPAPAPSALPATTNPAHAELIAELKRCLPAAPKLPASGARMNDESGRFVRRLKRPRAKTTPTRVRKPQVARNATIRVFKLAAGTTCEDVVSHVSAIVPHYLVRCRKILTKLKGPAFILEVPKEHRESVLDPSFWPEGVVTWARGMGAPFLEKMLKIRIFNVAEGTPVSDMVRHISQVVPEDKMTCERLDSKGRGETFKITMPRKYLRIVAAPKFWPAGVGVARLRTHLNPRKKPVKRKNPTDLDLVEDQALKRMKHGGKFRPSAYLPK